MNMSEGKKKMHQLGKGRVFSNVGKKERPDQKLAGPFYVWSRRRAFTRWATLPVESLASGQDGHCN